MTKILSVLLSAILAISNLLPGAHDFVDTLSTTLTGVPYYSLKTSDGFLKDIVDSSIAKLDENTGYVKNILLVFLKDNTSLIQRYKAIKSLEGVCIGYLEPANLFVLKVNFSGINELNALCEKAKQNECVAYASGSYAFKYKPDYTPNDPFNDVATGTDHWDDSIPGGSTWWLEAVNARDAWGYNSYFSHINIGIVDVGFDAKHPELQGKIKFPNILLESENVPEDHGTHVAGIIGAQADNGTGISGICQNSTLTCVDWEPVDGQLWIADLRIVFGVGYAVQAGAKVVNLSLGSSGSIEKGKPAYPKLWMDAEAVLVSVYMAALLGNGYDFVAVQSAGNGDHDGNPVDSFNNGTFCCITKENCFTGPFNVSKQDVLDRIIIVGCARNLGSCQFEQSDFSNVGSGVSICAPGENVYSCNLAEYNYYSYMSGTSMAAPVVTAVASLVWSVNPSLTGAQVKQLVCDKANTKYDVQESYYNYWPDAPYQSYRMVNAKLAVEAAIKTTCSVGTVQGRAVDKSGCGIGSEITAVCGDKVFRFCSGSDGYFSFLLPPGESVITITAADSSYSTVNASVTKDVATYLGAITIH